MNIARADTSLLGRWWWTVDHWTLAALGCLIGFGAVLAMAATPAVATRIGLDPFFFVRRQIALLIPAIAIMIAISMLNPRTVRLVAIVGFLLATTLLAATFFIGTEIKGARRWIHVPGLSIQPSEFVKPTFTIVAAWLFAMQRKHERFPGDLISIGLYLVVLSLLLLQPDVGMSIVITSVWFAQFFLAGLRMFWVLLLGGGGLVSLVGAYFVFPHVASRVDRFVDPASGDNYQVSTALEAFLNGGLFGRGPGEGTVKSVLPDAHSDFVFAVAGEEFGLIACLVLVALFAFIVLRGFTRALQDSNLFILLAVAGLLAQFGLQALINMGSTLNLIPTKGMTLPFISYGGSSLLALALGMGFMLALTRKRFGPGEML
ncbi:MAG TPA: putative peptidoglycan glycosyltransferase FtsW [Alphaproteobacteria bacterium]